MVDMADYVIAVRGVIFWEELISNNKYDKTGNSDTTLIDTSQHR
jgi:hypothetical protein